MKNKKIFLVNVVALVILFSVVIYAVFIKDNNDKGSRFKDDAFRLEDMCERFQDSTREIKKEGFDKKADLESYSEKGDLIEKICADGEVTEEEKKEFEESMKNFKGRTKQ